jgi:site-specific DNA-methyltransferase (adenine-specific)
MIEIDQIYNEDCLLTMQRMPDGMVDLVVTSPPYDNLRTYNGYSFDFERIAKELYRVVKQGGVVVWIVNDATIDGSETGTSFKQALYFKEIGFKLHDTMIWEKNCAGCLGSNKCYLQNFEYMFIFSKGKLNKFHPIEDRKNKETPSDSRSVHGSYIEGESTNHRRIVTKEYGRRTNIWNIQPQKLSKHPAAYPEQLAADHIYSWSEVGGVVYDPFMGSGTTAKMAVRLKRHYIGSEISVEYAELARKRVWNEERQLSLDFD